MRSKSTTSQGREHEEFVVQTFEWAHAWRSRSSGAAQHAPIDVTTDPLVIECESTEAKSYRLTLDYWNEVKEKQHTGKLPALAIRFRDPTTDKNIDLLVMDLHDASEQFETLEALREQALVQR